MGNSLGGKKTAKIMKVNGETFKLKTPVTVADVVKNYPGYVILESEAVKHLGIHSKPLDHYHELKPKKLYFLVELPKIQEVDSNIRSTRRVRSGINMSAKDRLESMMLAKRSMSELSVMRGPRNIAMVEEGDNSNDPMRVKLRLPRAEVERLMAESKDETEAAERLLKLCMGGNDGGGSGGGHERIRPGLKARGEMQKKKRVNFMPISEREIQLAVA